MTLLAGIIAAAGGSDEHLYWRINISAGNDATMIRIAEVQYRETVGGADQASGGTASESSAAGGTSGDEYDDDNATFWESTSGAPQWTRYQFSSAVAVGQVALISGDTAARAADMPKDFTIEYSDDGSSWTVAKTVTGETGWGVTETRTYNI